MQLKIEQQIEANSQDQFFIHFGVRKKDRKMLIYDNKAHYLDRVLS